MEDNGGEKKCGNVLAGLFLSVNPVIFGLPYFYIVNGNMLNYFYFFCTQGLLLIPKFAILLSMISTFVVMLLFM